MMSHGRYEGDSQLPGSALSHTLITPYMCIMLYSLALCQSVLFKALVSKPVKHEVRQPETCPERMSATGCAARPTPNQQASCLRGHDHGVHQVARKGHQLSSQCPAAQASTRPVTHQSDSDSSIQQTVHEPLVFRQYGRFIEHIHGQVRSKQAQSR